MKFKRSHSIFKIAKNQKRVLLLYFFFAFFSGPIAILLHEGGHYIGAKISGYTNCVLHYASFSRGDPPVGVVDYKRNVIITGLGPLVTLIISLICCIGAYFYRKKIFFIAMGLLTSIRNLSGFIIIILHAFGGKIGKRNDEVKLAAFLDIPTLVPLIISFLIFIGTWMFLIRQIDQLNRKRILLSIILGGLTGLFLWMSIIGPWILP